MLIAVFLTTSSVAMEVSTSQIVKAMISRLTTHAGYDIKVLQDPVTVFDSSAPPSMSLWAYLGDRYAFTLAALFDAFPSSHFMISWFCCQFSIVDTGSKHQAFGGLQKKQNLDAFNCMLAQAMIYLEKAREFHPITCYNVQRLIAVSVLESVKIMGGEVETERPQTMSFYAQLFGFPRDGIFRLICHCVLEFEIQYHLNIMLYFCSELVNLEATFLQEADWEMHVPVERV